jgi:hypothetical protein
VKPLPLAALGVTVMVLGAAPAAAQRQLGPMMLLEGAFTRARSSVPGAAEVLSGGLYGGEAVLARRQWRLRLGYAQGSLTADSGSAIPRDLAEGRMQIGVAAAPWLVLWAGPRARSYGTAAGRQRWWFWELCAEGRGTLFVDRVYALGGLTFAPAGSVDAVSSFEREAGLLTGLAVRLNSGGRELWTRLAYRVDQTRLGGGRRETVEAMSLRLALQFR